MASGKDKQMMNANLISQGKGVGQSAMSAYPNQSAAGSRQALPDLYQKNKVGGGNVGYQQ